MWQGYRRPGFECFKFLPRSSECCFRVVCGFGFMSRGSKAFTVGLSGSGPQAQTVRPPEP